MAARPTRRRARLLVRLDETRRILDDAHERLAAAADREVNVSPAGEWLLDNLHVVQEHIREVRESLPRGYYRELPELAAGALAGYPRVYEIAITLISHTEARVELESVDLFLGAFQQVRPLAIGELWAIPAMLRLGLIESVRRMALRTVRRLEELEDADRWAGLLADSGERDRRGRRGAPRVRLRPSAAHADLRRPPPGPAPRPRPARTRRCSGWSTGSPSRGCMPRRRPREPTSGWRSRSSSWRTASPACAASRGWTGKRSSSARAPWRRCSAGIRRGVYAGMTFETRDQYRHVVERISKRSGLAEPDVARIAVDLALAAPTNGAADADRRRHVGYYLVDEGLAEVERRCRFRPPRRPQAVSLGDRIIRTSSSSAASSRAPSPPIAAVLWLAGPEARAAWPLVLLFALIPANDIAVNAMNQLLTAVLPPRRLPKLDLVRHGGVPERAAHGGGVPTLFGSVEAVREALDHLEVQYLANREAHLQFAILSDFTDSPTETRDDDAAILAAAVAGHPRRSTPRYARRRRGRLLPVPSAAAVESEPRRVDGLGAEARQAGRVQPLPARRRERRVLERRGRHRRRSATCAT